MSTNLITTPEVLSPSGHKDFTERMRVLRQISDVTGIRLPSTIVPEGESLIPYGVERQRQLKEDIYSLPTVQEAVSALADLRDEQAPRNTTLELSRVRMNEQTGGIFDTQYPAAKPWAYTATGFGHLAGYHKPESVKAGFAATLLALPVHLRAEAFNHFAASMAQEQDRPIVLRSTLAPAYDSKGNLTLRRTVNAVVSERYGVMEDHTLLSEVQRALPDGARVRYTQSEQRSDLEVFWPAMSRELKVGDIALVALQLVNSQTKHYSIKILGKVLRVLCLNFTTAWGSVEEDVSIKHVGEVAAKLAEGIRRALDRISPFILAFGDAYANRFPVSMPTRGEVIGHFLKANLLPEKAGSSIAEAWDMDGDRSAGDTLAGLANAVTRATQVMTLEGAAEYEKAAGKLIAEGWASIS